MNDFHLLRMAVAALLVAVPACGDDEPSGPATSFTATLTGANEVPPVPTTATGNATLSLSGDQITYTVNVTSPLQNPVVAHIHIAAEGQNGPVRMNLCGTGDPQPACAPGAAVLATGTNGTTVGTPAITFDSLLSAMRTGGAYVNVHTDDGQAPPNTGPGDMASGEIRGQVVGN
jgi:hypothetical protein